MVGYVLMITTTEEALDTILQLVQFSETNFENALAATVTIYKLMEKGYGDLALQVLRTYGSTERENR